MAKAAIKLSIFSDNNIPDSIGNWLQRRGHSVFRLRKHMPDDSPDPVVAAAALEADRILLTQDKDFNSQRFMQPRFASLSRISLSGDGPTLLPAIKEHIRLIEFQWAELQTTGARMIVHVRVGNIRFRA